MGIVSVLPIDKEDLIGVSNRIVDLDPGGLPSQCEFKKHLLSTKYFMNSTDFGSHIRTYKVKSTEN